MTAIAYSSQDARLFFLEERKVLVTFRPAGVALPRRGDIISVADGAGWRRLKVLQQISARKQPSFRLGRRAQFEPRFVCELLEPLLIESIDWSSMGT